MLIGKWLEVTVAAPEGLPADLCSAALFEAGASGLEERAPRSDGRAVLVAYFPRAAMPLDAGPIAAAGGAVTSVRGLPDRDWEAEWRRGLASLALGERLMVVPASLPSAPRPERAAAEGGAESKGANDLAGKTVIRLDPGSAFGTGHHATTSLVAEALERDLAARLGAARAGAAPPSLADVGTGSGILAIAGYLLGARPVLAVDSDPEAVEEARRNARLNGCAEGIEASARPLEEIGGTFDVVVANLDAPTLARVGGRVAALVARGGTLIVSGLREDETWPAPPALDRAGAHLRAGWRCEVYRLPV
jgi:ribosomal protein L11 methyltransferase